MRVSTRLLFTLVFVAFILPKMLPFLGYQQIHNDLQTTDPYTKELDKLEKVQRRRNDKSLADMDLRDPALERCIEFELDRHSRSAEVASGRVDIFSLVKRLDCDGKGIKYLDGINKLEFVEVLSLRNNEIRSVRPLLRHPSLRSLDLSGNDGLSSVETLASINNLTRISFPQKVDEYCANLKSLEKKLRRRHGAYVRTNIKSVDCRGKVSGALKRALRKHKRGTPMNSEERKLVDDYYRDQWQRG